MVLLVGHVVEYASVSLVVVCIPVSKSVIKVN